MRKSRNPTKSVSIPSKSNIYKPKREISLSSAISKSSAPLSKKSNISSNIGGPPITKQPKRVTLLAEVDVVDSVTGNRQTNKQNIFGGSLYSKALLRGGNADDEIKYELQNEGLQYLEGIRRLFFRKCSTFPPELKSFNPKNKRGIWNEFNRVIFYTGKKEGYICRGCHYSGFVHEVVDYSGKTVIIAKGQQFVFGLNSKVEIFLDGGRLLGTMQQTCLSSTYEIKDSSGRLVYKIQAPCFAPCAPFVFWCCKEQFELCMDDGVTEIGKITKSWGSSVPVSEFRSCLGIEMDRVDDVRVKALLLGCFFLIEFQYFKWGGNGPVYFLLMFLIFASIVAVFECAGYCPFWTDGVFSKRIERV